jgi:glycosyltransferase involved in cell wall biosynthesis
VSSAASNDAVDLTHLRVAVIHEWLVDYSGSERVLEQILNVVPHADLFAVVEFLPDSLRGFIRDKAVQTTFIQRLPGAAKRYRSYLPLMPLAIEQQDLSRYDLVISSSHAVAKGVLTGPNQVHVSYVHSPMRYAWDLQHQYLRQSGLDRGVRGWLARWMLHKVRTWDAISANRVDQFIANSQFIARRIRKVYRRESEIVYPPVDVSAFGLRRAKEDFYLTVSRMVPYKRVDLVVQAFSAMPGRRLVVIGDGPELRKISGIAGRNVEVKGFLPATEVADYMQRARAFVFAAEEDFGIAPVEAQACGTPVIAFGKGGALETVRGLGGPNPTGVFFYAQEANSIVEAVERFEANRDQFAPESCRESAVMFGPERFRSDFARVVTEAWARYQDGYATR